MFSGGEKMSRRPLFAFAVSCVIPVVALVGCGNNTANNKCSGSLADRAYIVSKNSDEVHVIDLTCMELIGKVNTGGQALHMLDLNPDYSKAYVDSELSNETIVFDARTLTVTKHLA